MQNRNGARSAQPDAVLLSVGWGSLWGVVLGLWLLAPLILEVHHLRPEVASHWTVLLGALTVVFAVLGAVLGLVGGIALLILEKLVGGTFVARAWAYGLFSGISAAIAYVIQSVAIYWMTFRSFNFEPAVYRHVGVFIVSCVIAAAVLAAVYRWVARRASLLEPVILGWTLAAVAVSGAVALILRTPAASSSSVDVGPLERLPSAAQDVPLLFIGLDGGTWRLLSPAIESGRAPTLKRLVERGMAGTMEAQWPPYWSGPAWASILTGLPRERTGVYEDLGASVPGLPLFQVPIGSDVRLNPFYSIRTILVAQDVVTLTPPTRPLLRAKPIWQLLHEAGVRTGVIRFRFTYPARGQAALVVSDWVGRDQWEGVGVRRQPVEPIVPAERSKDLLTKFHSEGPSDPQLFARLLPGPRPDKPTDLVPDPIRELEMASDIDERTFNASESVLRADPKLPFLAVYIGGMDSVQHAFWQYRFPDEFRDGRPAAHDIDRLGNVPDEYVHYLDERLGELLALYASEPNVVIVSDHGAEPATFGVGWRGWHSREGIFIAAGPSVPQVSTRTPVSYFDIVPTIARLKGFREPRGVQGRSVMADATPD